MTSDFSRVRFIMTEPSHPGNVGSASRAIKTMGFENLVLVAPKTPEIITQPEAIALASGAGDVLAGAQTFDSLKDALAPVTLAFALTARERELGPPACDIREAAHLAQRHLREHPEGCVALVVGTERSGLTNEHIALCHRVCHIPANPAYSSLNVSQAMQLGCLGVALRPCCKAATRQTALRQSPLRPQCLFSSPDHPPNTLAANLPAVKRSRLCSRIGRRPLRPYGF
jgi:tRNA/rRNA methyltransferase